MAQSILFLYLFLLAELEPFHMDETCIIQHYQSMRMRAGYPIHDVNNNISNHQQQELLLGENLLCTSCKLFYVVKVYQQYKIGISPVDRLHNDALFKGFYSSFLLKEPNKMKQQQELLLMCGNLMCNTILYYTSSACKDYTRVNENNIGVYSIPSCQLNNANNQK